MYSEGPGVMNTPAEPWPRNIHVCIPSYQSSGGLAVLLPELLRTVPAKLVCVVDDGSTDNTRDLCRQNDINCLSQPENLGKGAALAAGFSSLLQKGADAVITMDADGQHAVADLPDFIETFRRYPDTGICIGQRKINRRHMPLLRIFSNSVTSRLLTLLCGVPVPDSQCGYRLYSAAFLKKITIKYPRFEMESEVIIKAARLGFPVRFIKVQTVYLNGTSHISHVADTLRWIKAVLEIRFFSGKSDTNNP
jgi:glycosyltransferase involved in cell wall biosynthesis